MSDDDASREFVTRQWEPLSRTAYLLTRDRALAEDLVQAALEKTHRQWRRVDAPEVYTRRVMISTAISWRRRRKRRERAASSRSWSLVVLQEVFSPLRAVQSLRGMFSLSRESEVSRSRRDA